MLHPIQLHRLIILSIILTFFSVISFAQSVYKTPSGDKYHLTTCKHVNNVALRMTVDEAINKYHLSPCKKCKPPVPKNAIFLHSGKNKAVGACEATRCKGKTKEQLRCKRRTKLCNGFCFQHNPDK